MKTIDYSQMLDAAQRKEAQLTQDIRPHLAKAAELRSQIAYQRQLAARCEDIILGDFCPPPVGQRWTEPARPETINGILYPGKPQRWEITEGTEYSICVRGERSGFAEIIFTAWPEWAAEHAFPEGEALREEVRSLANDGYAIYFGQRLIATVFGKGYIPAATLAGLRKLIDDESASLELEIAARARIRELKSEHQASSQPGIPERLDELHDDLTALRWNIDRDNEVGGRAHDPLLQKCIDRLTQHLEELRCEIAKSGAAE